MSKLSKALIYGGNFVFPSLVNILKKEAPNFMTKLGEIPVIGSFTNPNVANAYGAVFYGGLDILGMFSEKIKNGVFTGLAKAAGFGYYGISTAADLFSIAGGDYKSFAELPFDASMAYQLGKETFEIYGRKSIAEDLSAVKDSCKKLIDKVPKKNKGYAKVKIRNK